MSLLSKKAISSLRGLGRQVPLGTLPQLQPILLLQALIGVSQTLNSSAVQLEVLARTLIMDGQQQLRRLRDAAPHLHLPVEQLLQMIRSEDKRQDLSDEESMVQAMLEMCLGLVLQWLSRSNCQSYPSVSSVTGKPVLPVDALFRSRHLLLLLPLRVRACPIF